MSERGRVGILISGRGSNMVALVDAMRRAEIPAEPVLVLSNSPTAAGLEAAAERGVPTLVVDSKQIKPRSVHEDAVIDALREQRVDLVCLAGYMRLLTAKMVTAFPQAIMNIHPSLLPSFPGLHAQRQALEHGAKVAGCTVHYVDEECDHGPIILQAPVPVREGDTEDSLSARILELEHQVYPKAVSLYFERRLRVEGRNVRILPEA